jgi:HPt (histidine-containing phosphotransfer) domain-containing protein
VKRTEHYTGRPAMPVLDFRVLAEVAREVGTGAADRFLATYLGLLPQRIDRVASAIASSDLDAAMDAVLSLRVTSSMIGAVRLELYCRRLQDELADGHFTDAETAKAMLTAHAALVLSEVRARSSVTATYRESQDPLPG